MRSATILAVASVLSLSSASLVPDLVNTPNFLLSNAITLALQQYAGYMTADTFAAAQAILAASSVTGLSSVAEPLRLAFNAGALSSTQSSLTLSNELQRVSRWSGNRARKNSKSDRSRTRR